MKKLISALVIFAAAIAASAQSSVTGNLPGFAYGSVASVQSRTQTTIDAQGNFVLQVNNAPATQTILLTPPANSQYPICNQSISIAPGANNITSAIAACVSPTPVGVNLGIPNQTSIGTNPLGFAIPGSISGGGLSGQTTGCVPVAANATSSTSSSSICDNGSVASTTEPFQAPSFSGSGATQTVLNLVQGSAAASAPAHAIQFGAPTSVTSSYTAYLPTLAPTDVSGDVWVVPSGGGTGTWQAYAAAACGANHIPCTNTANSWTGVQSFGAIIIGPSGGNPSYNALSLGGSIATAAFQGFIASGSDPNIYVEGGSANVTLRYDNANLNIPGMTITPTAGQSACVKSAGPPIVLGQCGSVVGAGWSMHLQLAVAIVLILASSFGYGQDKPRTIDFTQIIRGVDGQPLKNTSAVNMTLGEAAVYALETMMPNENPTGIDKFKLDSLARRIYGNKGVVLTVEELAIIKERIGKIYAPSVVGPAWRILDPAQK